MFYTNVKTGKPVDRKSRRIEQLVKLAKYGFVLLTLCLRLCDCWLLKKPWNSRFDRVLGVIDNPQNRIIMRFCISQAEYGSWMLCQSKYLRNIMSPVALNELSVDRRGHRWIHEFPQSVNYTIPVRWVSVAAGIETVHNNRCVWEQMCEAEQFRIFQQSPLSLRLCDKGFL